VSPPIITKLSDSQTQPGSVSSTQPAPAQPMTTSNSAATSSTAVGSSPYVLIQFQHLNRPNMLDPTGNLLIPEIRKCMRIGTRVTRPKRVDRLGGIEYSVVGTGLDVCYVLVGVGLVNRRGCSCFVAVSFCCRCILLQNAGTSGYFAPIVDWFLFTEQGMTFDRY